jgi:hypothetical protein
MVRKR